MSEIIKELKQKYPAEFKEYEQELLKENIKSVQEGLGILLSIKGVIPETQDEDE